MSGRESTHSSSLEKLVEHLLVGEILKFLWLNDVAEAEVVAAEVDSAGWDIGLIIGGNLRFIQLKMKKTKGKTSRFKINSALEEKPGGCIVIIQYNETNLDLGPFLWYGGDEPNQKMPALPLRMARHTKGNKDGVKTERPNIRVLTKRNFLEVSTLAQLVDRLFPGVVPR